MGAFTLTLLVVVFYLCVNWLAKKYRYWSDRNVKSARPVPFLGNIGMFLIMKKSMADVITGIYNQFPGEKYVGLYQGLKPAILVKDPNIIKNILIKDFEVFQNRGVKKLDDSFEENLFVIEGDRWKMLRKKLTPIFTSGKIKNMLPLIDQCVERYVAYIDRTMKKDNTFEIRDLAAKFTLEVIGSCAFGMELNVFDERDNVFRDVATEIFNPGKFTKIVTLIDMVVPLMNILNKFNLLKSRLRLRHFFLSLVSKIIHEREGKPKIRKDFMDLLIDLKEQGRLSNKDSEHVTELELNPEIIAAQALIFYAAGFETSSAAMSFLIHELAFNQEIQERAHKEVTEVLANNNGSITYESISDLKYLEMCLDETLRRYPIAGALVRKASADYKVPDTDLVIEKGTTVFIPTGALQLDPSHFKEPKVFNPERFSQENKANIHPSTYIPFGEGPRNCIGMRFARVESLVAMAHLLSKFKFEPSGRTERHLAYDPKGVTLTSSSGIWVTISRRY